MSPKDACSDPGFLPCGGNSTACVPKEWFCDGNQDCKETGRDEECCHRNLFFVYYLHAF